MKNQKIIFAVLGALCITGMILAGFMGGIITGVTATLLLTISLGKWQLTKATARMDRLQEKIKARS